MVRETHTIVTRLYTGCSNAQLVPTRVCFVDFLSSYPLGRSLDSSSDEGATLLGVGKALTMEDLKFPVFFGKSDDGENFKGERDPKDGGHHSCDLHCGYMLWSETTLQFRIEGQTWTTTLPGASITS